MKFFNGLTFDSAPVNIVLALVASVILIRLNDFIFDKIDNGKKLIHLTFFRRILKGVVVILAIVFAANGTKGISNIYGLVFGSSILITALVGIVGKDALSDILAGLMISIFRPFNIGDRVLLSDIDKPCVVNDMTMRHVVLKTMDNICYIIPNSSINSKIILNTSYNHGDLRGTFLKFEVAYTSNVWLAIQLIREAVKNCPLTLPNNAGNKDLGGYGDVYLMEFNGNAYVLETTIWTETETDNFLAASEVRLAVIDLFRKNDIEIPFKYVNFISKDETSKNVFQSHKADRELVRRNVKIKTDRIHINNYVTRLDICLKKADEYSSYYNFTKPEANRIRLVTEELINFTAVLFPEPDCNFWISGNSEAYKVHILIKNSSIDNVITDELMDISDNELDMNMTDWIKYSVYSGLKKIGKGSDNKTLWNSNELGAGNNSLEKSILIKMTDNISISTLNSNIHIIASNKLKHKGGSDNEVQS